MDIGETRMGSVGNGIRFELINEITGPAYFNVENGIWVLGRESLKDSINASLDIRRW